MSEIETRFVEIVNTDSRAFKDEASLNFMLEVDKAKRVGAYGVVTPYGKSCITCLSTSCKLGLLLLYYNHWQSANIYTSLYRAGAHAWNALSRDHELHFYIEPSWIYDSDKYDSIKFRVDGIVYDAMEFFFVCGSDW